MNERICTMIMIFIFDFILYFIIAGTLHILFGANTIGTIFLISLIGAILTIRSSLKDYYILKEMKEMI